MAAIDLVRRYSASAWRHRWKAVALIWLVALLGWTGVRMLPDRYVSTARIYADADAVLGMLLRGIAMDNSPAAQVEVLQRTLVSRPNLERLVDRSALSQRVAAGADREKTIDALARDLRFGSQARNLFTVEYVDTDPLVAHGVVQQVVDLFLELASGSDRRQMGNARAFLLQQLAAYEQQLREAERRRAEFTTRYQDLLAMNGSISRLDAVRTRIEAMRGELSDKISLRALLQQQIDALPEIGAHRWCRRIRSRGGAAPDDPAPALHRAAPGRGRGARRACGCPRSGRHQPHRRRHDARQPGARAAAGAPRRYRLPDRLAGTPAARDGGAK